MFLRQKLSDVKHLCCTKTIFQNNFIILETLNMAIKELEAGIYLFNVLGRLSPKNPSFFNLNSLPHRTTFQAQKRTDTEDNTMHYDLP